MYVNVGTLKAKLKKEMGVLCFVCQIQNGAKCQYLTTAYLIENSSASHLECNLVT